MKYLVSFRSTLKVSRYLFRALAVLLWLIVIMFSVFYIYYALHEKESMIRQELGVNFDQAQRYILRTSDMAKQLKYITESRLSAEGNNLPDKTSKDDQGSDLPTFFPLFSDSDCSSLSNSWRNQLQSLSSFLHYWRDNFSASYELNRVFLIGGDNLCMADFGVRDISVDRGKALSMLHERIMKYRSSPQSERGSSLYWISPGQHPGIGYFFTLTPVYSGNKLQALLGVEQTIRMENFMTPNSLPVGITITDDNNQPLISLSGPANTVVPESQWQQERSWFGYSAGYKQLILKKNLPPSSLSVIYSVPVDKVLEHIRLLILNAFLLNLLAGGLLFTLARMYEKRIFIPAETDAHRLEEHEQFNRKIVASAPVGICILRTLDGTNILSNELAHNYLNMLTHEDRQQLTKIICGQQVNFVDVLTSNQTNLQISFVHSRYRNENVAICVLVDVSSRVKMEESLQEMAQAAEQASQSKSMFLATVSHELRTPLYGIIGNLDLLQTQELPQGVDRLVTAMHNSSSLLLKIISDILDFSKIESEQLKIEPGELYPREVMSHITANYMPLIVRKQLALYCFIEPNVPQFLRGDAMRLQQVISNLLSNAIKFTDTGCIVLHLATAGDYLTICVRDTGVGIPDKEVIRLFDPFFQAGTGVQRNFQGTGLGLAICEKLINMMDGDIAVDSEPGMGSQFTIRIPLYQAQLLSPEPDSTFDKKRCWLAVKNEFLASYLESLLRQYGISWRRLQEEQPAADDIVVTDDGALQYEQVRSVITFCSRHIGIPVEKARGYWVHSIVSPYELPKLLKHIWCADGVETIEELPVQKVPEQNNDDMMILVVDDHPINRRLLADQLGTLGYQAKTANDGVDALNVMSKNHIDIVLSDVNMPNMDGYRLTQCIRQQGLTLPVIGVTANALAEEKQRCLESGMDSCLSKPVTLDILQQTLTLYAQRVRAKRQS